MILRMDRILLLSGLLLLRTAPAKADALPVQAFLDGVRIEQVAISPDGHYLSMVVRMADKHGVLVADRQNPGQLKPVLAGDPTRRINPTWCGWANDTRLLCGMRGVTAEAGRFYPFTKLVGVNADGSQLKVLNLNNRPDARSELEYRPQFQDQIIDWTPDEPDTVLMALDDDLDTFPSVVAVNVYTGRSANVMNQYPPILRFVTDGFGHIRLGVGFREDKLYQFARLDGDKQWRQLSKVQAFSDEKRFNLVAVRPNSNFAYAFRSNGDRQALWQIDLTDAHNPEVLFEHPLVDIDEPLFTPDQKLMGVAYETDKPGVYYTDDDLRAYASAIDKALPGRANTIVDMTRDQQHFIIRSYSDVVAPEYYLLSQSAAGLKLELVGQRYPALTGKPLAKMRAVNYPAHDGTTIPGYLTLPVAAKEQNLPLIVMPHGGPIARDSWGFDRSVQFLASRGYAVLQMNFRGSSGYGDDWYWSAHQDWGGLTYSDITDGARWAIRQGIADPARICIVGASFGGYAALLAATRDSQLFRCAVSIAGVSDLPELLSDKRFFANAAIVRRAVGTDPAKLKQDSPRRHVEKLSVPLLMIHGDHDYTVTVDQTELMATALKRANKAFSTVIIKDADHYFSEDIDERTLLTELERFLNQHLPTH